MLDEIDEARADARYRGLCLVVLTEVEQRPRLSNHRQLVRRIRGERCIKRDDRGIVHLRRRLRAAVLNCAGIDVALGRHVAEWDATAPAFAERYVGVAKRALEIRPESVRVVQIRLELVHRRQRS